MFGSDFPIPEISGIELQTRRTDIVQVAICKPAPEKRGEAYGCYIARIRSFPERSGDLRKWKVNQSCNGREVDFESSGNVRKKKFSFRKSAAFLLLLMEDQTYNACKVQPDGRYREHTEGISNAKEHNDQRQGCSCTS